MSFEFKYDKDGMPVKSQSKPASVDEITPEPVETLEATETNIESEPTQEVESLIEDVQPVEVKTEPIELKENSKDYNWKQLKKQKDLLEKRAQELEQALLAAKSVKQQPEEDLSLDMEEGDLVEGKHLSKVDKRIQKLEQQLRQYEQITTVETVKSRLKNQYPDWDKVFNEENLARLEVEYPEIAHTLNASTDVYKSGVSAYTMIKKLGIVSPEDSYIQDKILAHKNASKPKPVASISPQQGSSPLSQANAFANGLTEDLKAQLRKEMNDSIKSY